MTYLLFLPIIVSVYVLSSYVFQRVRHHFVDYTLIVRTSLMLTLAWALGGWMRETLVSAYLADLVYVCQEEIFRDLELYKDFVIGVIGGGP